MQTSQGSHDNRCMEINDPILSVPDLPSAQAVRRFWIALLVFLLAMLAGLVVIILIAAVAADPAHISPAG